MQLAKNALKRPARKPVKRSTIRAKPAKKPAKPVSVKSKAPKGRKPKRLVTAVKVKKAADPRRIGVRAMGIQSRPDAAPKGRKAVPQSSKSGPTGMPREGELAPDFVLPDCEGRAMQLSKLRGNPVVVYFYPKDDTPGCTIEAQEFTRDYELFRKKGVVVIGISKDDTKSHCAFRDKYSLKIPLLSDTDTKVMRRYGVWGERSMYGKKFMGTQRATFVIAADGHIMKVFPNVTPQGHSREILKIF